MHIGFVIVFVILLLTLLYCRLFDYDYECSNHPEEKKIGDYLKSSHSGIIRGIITGLLLGVIPLEAAVKNAAVFGITNPVVLYMGF